MAEVSIIGATKDWISVVNFGNENAKLDGYRIGEFEFDVFTLPPGAVSRVDNVKDAHNGISLSDINGNDVGSIPITEATHDGVVIYGLDDRLSVEQREYDQIPHAGVGILCEIEKVITIANFSDKVINLDGWSLVGFELEGELRPGEAERFEIEPVDTEWGLYLELIDSNEEIVDAVLFKTTTSKKPNVFDLDHRIRARELMKEAEELEEKDTSIHIIKNESEKSEKGMVVQSQESDSDMSQEINSLPKDEFDSSVGVDKVVKDRIVLEESDEDSSRSSNDIETDDLKRAGTAKMGSLNYSNANLNETADQATETKDTNILSEASREKEKNHVEERIPAVSSNLPPPANVGGQESSWITMPSRVPETAEKRYEKPEFSRSGVAFNDSWIKTTEATPISEERNLTVKNFETSGNSPSTLKDSWVATSSAIVVSDETFINQETFITKNRETNTIEDSWIESSAATPVVEENVSTEKDNVHPDFEDNSDNQVVTQKNSLDADEFAKPSLINDFSEASSDEQDDATPSESEEEIVLDALPQQSEDLVKSESMTRQKSNIRLSEEVHGSSVEVEAPVDAIEDIREDSKLDSGDTDSIPTENSGSVLDRVAMWNQ